MDIISRLVQFPSMFKSIDSKVLFKQLILYPFFNLLYILQSLKYQSDLIDQDQEFYPPVLCNDNVYTWYRMGLMNKQQKVAEIEEILKVEAERELEEKLSRQTSQERTGIVIDINYKEKSRQENISVESNKKLPADSVIEKVPVIENKVRHVSIYHKTSVFRSVNPVDKKEEVSEAIELSGFARFLRNKTVIKTEEEENLSVGPEQVDAELVESEDNTELTENIEESNPEKKKKKKDKKHKKKELVNQLVEQSVHDNELLVSEPFAELLYAQGYKDKAIKIYEKLMEKNPEKRLSFAAKIDKINKESF